MLKVSKVSKWFSGGRVLRNIDLDLTIGERVVLLGENGCGKSTLLQIVAGVMESFEGEIVRPTSIGYAPEKPDLPDHLLAQEWLDIVASLKRTRWHEELGVDTLLGRRVSAMSLGQRQRVSLVAALMGNPDLLVLDEPTNALDLQVRGDLIARVCKTTALIATHDHDFAERVATRIVTLHEGQLAG